MKLDFGENFDTIGEGVKNLADGAHKATKEFHKNYVSKVTPNFGKYGNAAKFVAEMAPGVSEYNALKDGDWTAFTIAAGIDAGAAVVGAVTAGSGYFAIKGGSGIAKASVKSSIKEVAEASTRKAVKEVVQSTTEKTGKDISEKIIKDAAAKEVAEKLGNKSVQKISKEVGERVIERVATINQKYLGEKFPGTEVEFVLKRFRDATGKLMEAVVPNFPSKAELTLPKKFWSESTARQQKFLNEQLSKSIEKTKNAYHFSPEQIAQIKLGKTPAGFTWHHDLPNGVMKLVDSELHSKVRHTGGMSLWGRGYRKAR
jgi:hypothetical protein